MNIKALLTLLVVSPTLISCACHKVTPIARDKDEDPIVEEDDNTPKVSELDENHYNEFTTHYINKINTYKSYKAITSGKTVTKALFIDVTQTIDVTSIKSEYSYLHNKSSSSMYSSEHIAYYHDGYALYKNKNDSKYTKVDMDAYLDKYGTYPFENRIEGYKVSGDALTSITKLDNDDNGNHRFKLVLDKDKSTTNVKIQMRAFGELDDYPSFSSIEMIITVKDDYTPINIELDSKYKANKIISTDCHQTYTVTYSNYDEDIDIPNLDDVKGLFE